MSEEQSERRKSFIRATADAGEQAGEFELNLAPVIDCLTVLIVYTIISASFLSLGAFSTTVPSEGKSVVSLAPVQIRIDMNLDRSLEVTVGGAETQTRKLPAKERDWDFMALNHTLNELKSKYALLSTVTLAAGPQVHYAEVVRTIERTKQSVPNVVLGE